MYRTAGGHFVTGKLILLLAVASAALAASQRQAPFRSSLDLVIVDVAVLDRSGNPVLDLGRDDFVVTVDGRLRQIQSVQLVSAEVLQGPSGKPVPRPPRTFVFVVDGRTIRLGEGQQMLEAAARFLDSLPPTDRLAVWTMESSDEPHFSEDRESLKARIRRSIGSYESPAGVEVAGRADLKDVRDRGGDQARLLLRSMSALIDALVPLDGPKHVVLLTGGPALASDNLSLVTTLEGRAAAARVTVHALQLHDPSDRARAEQRRTGQEATTDSQSAAYALADATGGLALTPVSGDVGFARLERQLSAVYFLTFEARESERDSALHRIEVKLRDGRRGATVRARRTFRIEGAALLATSTPSEATTANRADATELVGTELGSIAARLAEYIEAFEGEGSALLAEERYVQVLHHLEAASETPAIEAALAWNDQWKNTPDSSVLERRQLLSEVLLLDLPEDGWQGYRDVAQVDGKQVRDGSDRLQRLLQSGDTDRLLRMQEITENGLAHSIGDPRRFSFNTSTLALSLLRGANHSRFNFTRRGDQTLEGRQCRVLGFQETSSPTLLSLNGMDLYAYGQVWLDQVDGRVRRTDLRFDGGLATETRVTVEYRELEGVPVLLPARMMERYEGLRRPQAGEAVQQGTASYSNYRRFSSAKK